MTKKLSQIAWSKSINIIDSTINHPYNTEMKQGILAKDKFAYYIEQDVKFIHDFGRVHSLIAAKIQAEYAPIFLTHASHCFAATKTITTHVEDFLPTNKLTPATLSLTSYLLQVAALEPIEVVIAAILPCFWIYREVGLSIAKDSSDNNPYAKWIESYSNSNFIASVDEAINIFDALGSNASNDIQERMLEAFYKSSCLEWHFWNDAYNNASIEPSNVITVIGADSMPNNQ